MEKDIRAGYRAIVCLGVLAVACSPSALNKAGGNDGGGGAGAVGGAGGQDAASEFRAADERDTASDSSGESDVTDAIGLDAVDAGPAQLRECQVDSDCPMFQRCFIDAVVSACPSAAVGHCYIYFGGGNCDTEGPFDPCKCLKYGVGMDGGLPNEPCSDLPNTSCQAFFPSSAGMSRCWGCVSLATDASPAQ